MIIPPKPYIGGMVIPIFSNRFVMKPFLPSSIIHEIAPIKGGDISDMIIRRLISFLPKTLNLEVI